MRRTILAGLVVVGVACSSNDNQPPPPPPPPSLPTYSLSFASPMNGDVVEPGDTIDVAVSIGASGITAPLLSANGALAQPAWTPDPADATILHTPFTVPSTPGPLAFVASGANAMPGVSTLTIATPSGTATATTGATDTTLALPSGLTLVVPASAVPAGTIVTLSTYAAGTLPQFENADMLAPVARVHLSVNEMDVKGSMYVTQTIPSSKVSQLGAREYSLDVYEGPDPDPEGAPPSVHASLTTDQSGNGTLTAELPGDSFHHMGSSGVIMGLQGRVYPFSIDQPQLCASDSSDPTSNNCQPMGTLLSGSGTPVDMSCATGTSTSTAHLNVTANVAWDATAPAMQSPLSVMTTNSPFNPLRKRPNATNPTWRPHQGNDLAASDGTLLLAPMNGVARAHSGSWNCGQPMIEISNGDWTVRALHVSNFSGFTANVQAGDKLGTGWGTVTTTQNAIVVQKVDVTASVAGTYSIDCSEVGGIPMTCGTMVPLDCKVSGPAPVQDLIELAEGVWTRSAVAGQPIGNTGKSGVNVGAHLHMELWYNANGPQPPNTFLLKPGVPVDASMFLDAISQSPAENGSLPDRSPTIRLTAQLGDPVMQPPPLLPTGFTIVGLDPSSLVDASSSSVTCPYGSAPIANNYSIIRMPGPKGTTLTNLVSWDFGACAYTSVCATQSKDVKVTLGTTTWRYSKAADDAYAAPNNVDAWRRVESLSTVYAAPPLVITNPIDDGVFGWATQMASGSPQASDFEGMQVTVTGVNGEFATSTMTLTNVKLVGAPSAYTGSVISGTTYPPEAGNPTPLSTNIPSNAIVFSFGDNAQPAGVVGFPTTFTSTNIANRNGRSNIIALWQDSSKKWQWVFDVSGGSYNSGGGFPQEHEYQMVYDSRCPGSSCPPSSTTTRERYDVYLGPNGTVPSTSSGWSFNRTAATTMTVTFPKKLGYVLPGM